MSFLEEKVPSKAVRKLSEFTEQYIELFRQVWLYATMSILSEAHTLWKRTIIFIISPIYSAGMARLRSSIRYMSLRTRGNGGAFSLVTQ